MVQFIRQRKIIIWGLIICLSLMSVFVLQPFLVSLTMGFTFAVALVPVKRFFIEKLRFRTHFAATTVSSLATFFIIGPTCFVIYKLISLVNQNSKLVLNTELVENRFFNLVYSLTQQLGLKFSKQSLLGALEHVSSSTQDFLLFIAKATIASIPDTAVQLIILFFTLFVVLINYKRFTFQTLDAVGISSQVIVRMNQIIFEVCRDVVFANIITGFVQALMVTVGCVFLTDFDPILIFVITFVFSFIPVIGAAPVAIVLAIYQFSIQQPTSAITLLGVSVLVGVSDNIVRAKLMGRTGGENAFLNFLASIGGIYLWGVAGIFTGPLVVALTIRTVPLLLEELKPVAVFPNQPGK